jgi:hypothetical protein
MNRFTQTLLNFLIDRASGIPGQLTIVPAVDLMDASPEPHGGIKLWKSLSGDVTWLHNAGLITSPDIGDTRKISLVATGSFTYSITKAGLRAKTVEKPEAPLKTWRDRTPEERARR